MYYYLKYHYNEDMAPIDIVSYVLLKEIRTKIQPSPYSQPDCSLYISDLQWYSQTQHAPFHLERAFLQLGIKAMQW